MASMGDVLRGWMAREAGAILLLLSAAAGVYGAEGTEVNGSPAATPKDAAAAKVVIQRTIPAQPTKSAAIEMAQKAEDYLQAGKFRRATETFGESLRIEENYQVRRRLAQLYWDRGEAMRGPLKPEIDAAIAEYKRALKAATRIAHYFAGDTDTGQDKEYIVNWNHPDLVAAKKKFDELMRRAEEAFANYDMALVAYGKILELSPHERDFDAAGHRGLCYTVRGDRKYRALARQYLVSFLKEYKAGNDQEQALYKRCQDELKRINEEGDPDTRKGE
jgi:tetratricopeptide (TPR) repeat protein